MKRGERKARRMLELLTAAQVEFVIDKNAKREWTVGFPGIKQFTPEQRELATDLILFGIAYPRCFGTFCRLVTEARSV